MKEALEEAQAQVPIAKAIAVSLNATGYGAVQFNEIGEPLVWAAFKGKVPIASIDFSE